MCLPVLAGDDADSAVDEQLDQKALLVKIYDRIVSIAQSDISSAEMVWLVGEIWQRFQHVNGTLA